MADKKKLQLLSLTSLTRPSTTYRYGKFVSEKVEKKLIYEPNIEPDFENQSLLVTL